MITFTFQETKPHTQQERQDAQDFFIKYIGDIKEEFDKNEISVEVNMDATEFGRKYTFGSNPDEIAFLVWKVQEYRKANPLP